MMLLRASVAWHVFDLSGSAFLLGLIGIVQFVPALLLTLVGGALADSFDRRRILLLAQLPPMACAVLLYTSTTHGSVTLPLLYAVVFTVAVTNAFDSPARAAFLPTLVGREDFARAVPFASTTQALAFVTGPALGGILIAAAGIAAAYALYGALIVAAFGLLTTVRARETSPERRALSVRAIRDALGFVRRSPVILGCMSLDMFAVIFGGATALLPIYANQILDVGPRGFGLLSASLEAGSLLMAFLLLARRRPVRRAGRALFLAVGVYGLATIVFGLSRSFPLSLAAYAVAGMADQVSVVMRQTAVQLATPDALRGRVSAVNMIFINASNQLGAAESGFVAALTNATFAVVSGGIACLVVLAIIAWRLPELRAYRTPIEAR
jgi:MFS family permease